MKTKSLFLALALVAFIVTGCEPDEIVNNINVENQSPYTNTDNNDNQNTNNNTTGDTNSGTSTDNTSNSGSSGGNDGTSNSGSSTGDTNSGTSTDGTYNATPKEGSIHVINNATTDSILVYVSLNGKELGSVSKSSRPDVGRYFYPSDYVNSMIGKKLTVRIEPKGVQTGTYNAASAQRYEIGAVTYWNLDGPDSNPQGSGCGAYIFPTCTSAEFEIQARYVQVVVESGRPVLRSAQL